MKLTDQEEKIANMLGDAFNEYLKLPVQHPMETEEFCMAIHVCQNIVLSRPAVRHLKAKGELQHDAPARPPECAT
jgi:hypothetical protein